MSHIQFVDPSRSIYVQNGLTKLCRILNETGITASWCGRIEDACPEAILLLHDPVDERNIPKSCKVYGQRTLNRRQRLVLAERLGLRVPRWCSLDSAEQLLDIFDNWRVDHFLYKADWSYSRSGVRLVTHDKLVALNRFDPSGDIFMEVLEGSPHTFKVDVFYDKVIGCRKLFTRSVFDQKFARSFTKTSELGERPAVEPELQHLGQNVFNYGVGLLNVDIMLDEHGREWVIELNTCSVGRDATWKRWPETYISGYAKGIMRWVDDGCVGRSMHSPAALSVDLAEKSGGSSADLFP
jgi:hypothetical protein